jgi:16S rRNA (guanine966-N2)-methyltransferase
MKKGLVRIIGGQWRSRTLCFPATEGLRPTPNRVRERLFNWLDTLSVGPNHHCLDLFAGSGALGFEALSRGAASVTFIEQSSILTRYLRAQIQAFSAQEKAWAYCARFPNAATSVLKSKKTCFDLVFLDPPFTQPLLEPAFHWLIAGRFLAKRALVYAEMAAQNPIPRLPHSWEILREKVTGDVRSQLIKTNT